MATNEHVRPAVSTTPVKRRAPIAPAPAQPLVRRRVCELAAIRINPIAPDSHSGAICERADCAQFKQRPGKIHRVYPQQYPVVVMRPVGPCIEQRFCCGLRQPSYELGMQLRDDQSRVTFRMSEFKDQWVEVRYDENDYSKVWVVLPGVGPREAWLITPTSLINPDKETLKTVARLRARERQILREYELIRASSARGESVEDRVANASRSLEDTASLTPEPASPASVHLLRRLERRKLSKVPAPGEVTADQVAGIKADFSIFDVAEVGVVSEFDDEEDREEAIRARG